MPDLDLPDVHVRLCHIKIEQVGPGLPCVFQAKSTALLTHEKSEDTKLFDDYGILTVGRICPMNYPDEGVGGYQFRINTAFELPFDTAPTEGKCKGVGVNERAVTTHFYSLLRE